MCGVRSGLDEVFGCRWVAVRDKVKNRLFVGHTGGSQTKVPGLVLSFLYHCTSASSEHKGLLRKQLSLKDPLFQLMICCGLQGGVGVAGCSLDGVRLLWL